LRSTAKNGRKSEAAVFAGTDHAPGLTDALQLLLVVTTDWVRREFDQQIAWWKRTAEAF
jgi:hypothetical protein